MIDVSVMCLIAIYSINVSNCRFLAQMQDVETIRGSWCAIGRLFSQAAAICAA